jgi:HEAT repeat protein
MKKYVVMVLALLLAGCGGKSTAGWIDQLQAGESSQRLRAIKALEGRHREADRVVPALARALEDQDAFVRRDAARALARFGPRACEALPALLARLNDRNAAVRKAAAGAVKAIDPEAAARVG